MLSLSKVNPMARAIGTMGVVAGLVGVVTFANLTSNTVALTPNQVATASAALVIDNNDSCANNSPTNVTGFQVTGLAPGSSVTKDFCLRNIGDVPLDISASIPQDLSGSPAAQKTTLDITCANIGSVTGGLDAWGVRAFSTAALDTAVNEDCTATITLDSSYTGSGGEAIPAFSINFDGTQPTPPAPEEE
jgi:hypothetical protein